MDPLAAAWQKALKLLATQVNKPTYEAHLRPLRLASVSEAGEALLLAPHTSTREWIEKRHKDKLQEALRSVLGRTDVTVRLSLAPEVPGAGRAAQHGTAPRRTGTGPAETAGGQIGRALPRPK